MRDGSKSGGWVANQHHTRSHEETASHLLRRHEAFQAGLLRPASSKPHHRLPRWRRACKPDELLSLQNGIESADQKRTTSDDNKEEGMNHRDPSFNSQVL